MLSWCRLRQLILHKCKCCNTSDYRNSWFQATVDIKTSIRYWVYVEKIPRHRLSGHCSMVEVLEHEASKVSSVQQENHFWSSQCCFGSAEKEQEGTENAGIFNTARHKLLLPWFDDKIGFNLKQISQKWLFVKVISANKHKWQLIGQDLTCSSISNFSYKQWE